MKKTMSLSIAAIAMVLAGNAAAAPGQEAAPATVVQYNDLDLSTAAGRKTLDQRIDKAVRQICTDQNNTGSRITRDKACMRETRANLSKQFAAVMEKARLGG